eukprot:gb/GECG01008704.1/.p1 GENE.gb/GECG01008704.1/~~gb/GECG01008704.1/.p1  ORF type:complete len:112 (+),score=8.40 gb/GECG01008704.1/:1-336(+)
MIGSSRLNYRLLMKTRKPTKCWYRLGRFAVFATMLLSKSDASIVILSVSVGDAETGCLNIPGTRRGTEPTEGVLSVATGWIYTKMNLVNELPVERLSNEKYKNSLREYETT